MLFAVWGSGSSPAKRCSLNITDRQAILAATARSTLSAAKQVGGYVDNAQRVLDRQLHLPAGYTLRWSGEYEFQLRARKRLMLILPIVFGLIFVPLYMLFQSTPEAIVLILPTVYAMTGGLLLQYVMGFNFSVAVWVGYIALFGIAVETGVVMVIYLHEALNRQIAAGEVTHEGVEAAASGVQCSGFDRS